MFISISHGILEKGSRAIFNYYRGALATTCGLVERPDHLYIPDCDKNDWKYISSVTDYFGYWKEAPIDPIWYLIAHSDNSGYFTAEQALLLAARLTELQVQLKDSFGTDIPKINKIFITGFKEAANKNEKVTIKQD